MEVEIVSREMIKPARPKPHNQESYNLSLFDQLTPSTYAPLILFYRITDNKLNITHTITQLKTSLSQVLNLFYPFSGRIRNNLFTNDFNAGIPYFQAKVNCSMCEFLKHQETELLNKFLPINPFCKEKDENNIPLLAFQVNLFACNGIAIGVSLCHKISDGSSMNLFLKSWAAIFRGSISEIENPSLTEGSLLFPPRDSLPENYSALMDSLWFKEGSYITKKFVFSPKAIDALRKKAKSELVPKPSRSDTLTGFIWKHVMEASRTISGSPKISILAQAANMRPRMKPHLSNEAIGNLFWWAIVAANEADTANTELSQLVGLVKESIEGFDSEYLNSLKGEDGFLAVEQYIEQLEGMFELEEPDIFAFTNWTGFFHDIDFGWGTPFWIGVMGQVGKKFRNLTILTETKWGYGIEAWVTLDQKRMSILEIDSEFLAFASPNPGSISRL